MSDTATDGGCGLSWDDSIVTSMTPAPAGRCPFEYFHEYDDGDLSFMLEPEDVPYDWPVQPIKADAAMIGKPGQTFYYFVRVTDVATLAQADQVMAERINHFEDYGFEYTIEVVEPDEAQGFPVREL